MSNATTQRIRRDFLSNLSTWVMQELEMGRPMDQIAAEIGCTPVHLMGLLMLAGLPN